MKIWNLTGLALATSGLALAACSDTDETRAVSATFTESELAIEQEAGLAHAMTADEPVALAAGASSGGSFLAVSDVHLRPPGMSCSSSHHHCETSPDFWNETQTHIQGVVSREAPDFIIYLGDMPTHHSVPPGPRGDIFGSVLDGLSGLAGSSDTPVLYLPGNNDTLGHNSQHGTDYCPFSATHHTVLEFANDPAAWPVVNGSADIIDASHLPNGYYSALLPMGDSGTVLRVLALNTNIYTQAYTVCSSQAAADGSTQMDWLAQQLTDAAAASQPVLLAMHVPPGFDGYKSEFQTTPNTMWADGMLYQGTNPAYSGRWMQDVMLDLIATHADTITSVIAGHTHLNGIRRLHTCDAASTPTELLVSVPGISSDHGNRPAFRLFELDGAMEPVAVTTHNAAYETDYDWASGTSFGFGENYPNSAPAGSTLFSQVETLSTDALFDDMLRFLNAYDQSPPPSPGFFREAMDVTCRN